MLKINVKNKYSVDLSLKNIKYVLHIYTHTHILAYIMVLQKEKVTKYADSDPRYNFTIMDTIEYNTPIQPFRFKTRCEKNIVSRNNELNVGCDSQRYENCVQRDNENAYIRCELDFLDYGSNAGANIEARITDTFIPKKQQKNSFYSKTRLSKLDNPCLTIDNAPDVNVNLSPSYNYNKITNGHRTIKKATDEPEILENFGGNLFNNFSLGGLGGSFTGNSSSISSSSSSSCCLLLLCISCSMLLFSSS
jgi:hypothetical protein